MCVLLVSSAYVFASSTADTDGELSVRKRQNDITIACPRQISYQIETVSPWDAGMHGIKILKLEDATVSGRVLSCNYSANKGSVRDSSMLTREMPAGYICKNERHPGAKTWTFLCKRAVAPIRIKPKSE